tara:strand:+ start:1930 stop:2175 length:246 start_codon:yes stop_codon:yes gene_type:complete
MEKTMTNTMMAAHKVGQFIMNKTGVNFLEFPDTVVVSDWVDDDMTEKEIDEIVPDIAWEILDNSRMDRDTVNNLCYGENND